MRYLLFTLLTLIPFSAYTQVVDIESDRGGDKQGVHGSTEFGLSLQRGNVQVFQTQASLRLDYIKGIHHSLFIGSISYGEEDSEPFKNEMYSHIRWTAMWLKNIGTEVFAQTQKDEFRLLQIRQLTGAGLRFTALDGLIALGLGGMSDYEQIEGNNEGVGVFRGSSYVRVGKEWKNGVKGQMIAYYQPLFSDPSDYRILGVGAVEFKLDKVFSVVNEFNYSYDTRPPEKVINEDLQIKVKFKVKW